MGHKNLKTLLNQKVFTLAHFIIITININIIKYIDFKIHASYANFGVIPYGQALVLIHFRIIYINIIKFIQHLSFVYI